jgi:hypothetical protein
MHVGRHRRHGKGALVQGHAYFLSDFLNVVAHEFSTAYFLPVPLLLATVKP